MPRAFLPSAMRRAHAADSAAAHHAAQEQHHLHASAPAAHGEPPREQSSGEATPEGASEERLQQSGTLRDVVANAKLLAALRARSREQLQQQAVAGGAGAGGADVSSPVDPSTFSVNREELLTSIKRFQARDKYCWTLPLGALGFSLWCLALALHCNVTASNSVEYGCVGAGGRREVAGDSGVGAALHTATRSPYTRPNARARALPSRPADSRR
jgi:hypothetical protein